MVVVAFTEFYMHGTTLLNKQKISRIIRIF